MDPRPAIIQKRFTQIGKVLVFASGKGGVGKSSCSVTAALLLAKAGKRTGLIDLDFQGASCHILLDADLRFPEEKMGILPQKLCWDLLFMSVSLFAKEHGLPLRGRAVSEVFLELFAVTNWGSLDYLVVDMPPGIGDELLDVVKFIPSAKIVLVTTPSPLAVSTRNRMVEVLGKMGVSVAGELINLNRDDRESTKQLVRIPYMPAFEETFGNCDALVSTKMAHEIADLVERL